MWHHAQLPFDFCLILFFTVCICEWVSELRCPFVLQCGERTAFKACLLSLSQVLLFLLCAWHHSYCLALLASLPQLSGEFHYTFLLTVGVLAFRWVLPNPSFSTEPSPWPSFTFAVLGIEPTVSNTLDNLSFFVGALVVWFRKTGFLCTPCCPGTCIIEQIGFKPQPLPPECKGEGLSNHIPDYVWVSYTELQLRSLFVCLLGIWLLLWFKTCDGTYQL